MPSIPGRYAEAIEAGVTRLAELHATRVEQNLLTWRIQDPVELQDILRALLRPCVPIVQRHEAVNGLVEEVTPDFGVAECENPVAVIRKSPNQKARVDDEGRVED